MNKETIKHLKALLQATYNELTDDNSDHEVVLGLVAEAKAIIENDKGSFDSTEAI